MPTDTLELLKALVAIDSVNPSLVAGGAGEREIAAFVVEWAHGRGLDAEVLEQTPGRPSVVARAHGTGGGRALLLCGHYDTVTVEGMADPHAPRLDGDRLHGRGAYDMKAGLAAALVACREAGRRGFAGDVLVAAVADEEYSSRGVQEVLDTLPADPAIDAAIVTEPTDLALVVAHKGFVWSEVDIRGRAAHGSRARTWAWTQSPRQGRSSPSLLGSTNAWTSAATRSWVARQRTLLVREPFEIAADAPLVELARDAAAAVLGTPPAVGGASYWADAAFIAAAGIPTILFGPSGEGAHAAEEWVSVSATESVAEVLIAVAERVCR